jgi:hypothetical protein
MTMKRISVLIPLFLLACAGTKFTNPGNPPKALTIELGANESSALFGLKLCATQLSFTSTTGAPPFEVPLSQGEISLSSAGTEIATVTLSSGSYSQVKLNVDASCTSGKSIEVVNSSGVFSTADASTFSFAGQVEASGAVSRVRLGLRPILDQLASVSSATEIKAKAELSQGEIQPVASSDPSSVSIVWEKAETSAVGGQFPRNPFYMKPVFDAVSGTSLWYATRLGSTGSFSTDMFSYKASTRTWTRLGGTGSTTDSCNDGSASTDLSGNPILPWPSDRQAVEQMTIDTSRGRFYMAGGVCSTVTQNDTWFYDLNPNPMLNRWTNVSISAVPDVQNNGGMEYSPADDVIVLHGTNTGNFPKTWVFCPVSPAGSLSASQTAAGCTSANDWHLMYSPATLDPPQSYLGSLVHLPGTGKMLLFGHKTTRGIVWAYDIAAKSWTDQNPIGQPWEPSSQDFPERLFTYVSTGSWAGKVLYHQTSHSPSLMQAADWAYDPVTRTWTQLNVSGIGPQKLTFLVFDPTLGTHGTLIAFSYDGGLWHGTLK